MYSNNSTASLTFAHVPDTRLHAPGGGAAAVATAAWLHELLRGLCQMLQQATILLQ
jgi:hypothetical protein